MGCEQSREFPAPVTGDEDKKDNVTSADLDEVDMFMSAEMKDIQDSEPSSPRRHRSSSLNARGAKERDWGSDSDDDSDDDDDEGHDYSDDKDKRRAPPERKHSSGGRRHADDDLAAKQRGEGGAADEKEGDNDRNNEMKSAEEQQQGKDQKGMNDLARIHSLVGDAGAEGKSREKYKQEESNAMRVLRYALATDDGFNEKKTKEEEKMKAYAELSSTRIDAFVFSPKSKGKYELKHVVAKKISPTEGILLLGDKASVKRALGEDTESKLPLPTDEFETVRGILNIETVVVARRSSIFTIFGKKKEKHQAEVVIKTKCGDTFKIRFKKSMDDEKQERWVESLQNMKKYYNIYGVGGGF
mmetsp:Transcript_9166/g.14660  ORF Transcript_9166/g.14660 Transcript_9166/m.14660 type:complete len:357 (-) Transcript_9166:89-1159(-)